MSEIENIIKEREGLIAAEKLGGNVVKENFHRGVLMGITIAKSILSAQLEEEKEKRIRVCGLLDPEEMNKYVDSLKNSLTIVEVQLAEKDKEIDRWIKVAGENQKSANKSADWAEKAEAELTALREKAKGIEEVHALIKSDFSNCFNSKEIDVLKANAAGMWQVINNFVEEKK